MKELERNSMVRKKIVSKIRNEIDKALNRYYDKYKESLGYLLYYPLINIEYEFISNGTDTMFGVMEKEKVTWFLKHMSKRGITTKKKFIFKKEEFEYYRNTVAKQINELYQDYRFSKEIEDEWSIASAQVTKIEDNKYELISSLVNGKYNNSKAYYFGYGDKDDFNAHLQVMKSIEKYFKENYYDDNINESIRKIKRLIIDIDKKLVELCIDRVDFDTRKMGDKVSSKVIRYRTELNKILAFFVYISEVVLQYCKLDLIKHNFDFSVPVENYVRILDKEWVINKINKVFNIDKDKIEIYIDYLSFYGVGIISDFPILIENNNIIIVPSLFLLNDWQFSITNGHYAKNIEFTRRDKTISHSVVSKVYNKFLAYGNISVVKERYYEYIDKDGKKKNSDIDVAVYDKLSNTILVFECKWKDNHYIDDDENHIKIQNGMKEIFNKQISKHKEFLEKDISNIKYIFENIEEKLDINEQTNIFYIALDKRSEFHIEDQHMISLYGILALCEEYSKGDILDLCRLIDDINTAKMKVEYFMVEDAKEYQIDDMIIVNDELYLDYDNYFI